MIIIISNLMIDMIALQWNYFSCFHHCFFNWRTQKMWAGIHKSLSSLRRSEQCWQTLTELTWPHSYNVLLNMTLSHSFIF